MITYKDIIEASYRVSPLVNATPIYQSRLLNNWLNQQIFFKCECLQKTGSFKIRGATNFVEELFESHIRVTHLVANSSGNHAQAVAYVAAQRGLEATIFANKNISPIKAAATQSYGAELRLFSSRNEADMAVQEAAEDNKTVWIPPFNHPAIMAGQGTAAKEAIEELDNNVDAVFTPCGGGGLTSGTLVATRALAPKAKMIASEPLAANDAAQSIKTGKIISLTKAPDTIADGVATPAVGDMTFPLLQQLDDMVEVSEDQICYWTQWLQHLLKLHVEPTSAMTMQAVLQWAKTAPPNSRALVILSGGNISQATQNNIWNKDWLAIPPSLDMEIM